jgi:hypothetical protein
LEPDVKTLHMDESIAGGAFCVLQIQSGLAFGAFRRDDEALGALELIGICADFGQLSGRSARIWARTELVERMCHQNLKDGIIFGFHGNTRHTWKF